MIRQQLESQRLNSAGADVNAQIAALYSWVNINIHLKLSFTQLEATVAWKRVRDTRV